MPERIGVVVGWEQTFPQALIEKINKTPGYVGELAKFGATPAEGFKSPYRVLVDRLSHEVPFYRFHLKAAALAGTYVINDPWWWSADEKMFGFSLAAKIGVSVPRTVMLPQRAYIPSIDPQRSLRNLEYPLDWQAIADYVGFPAILKPADGGGWKNVTKVHNLDELLKAYNESGTLVMTLQQFIDFDEYVRVVCIGREFMLPIKYDPKHKTDPSRKAYVEQDGFMPKALEQLVLDGCWALNNALGYDMNSVEFACKDGIPYAIDFTNPAPDMDRWSLGERYHQMCVDEMAKFCIKVCKEDRKNLHSGFQFRRYIEKPLPRPKGLGEYVAPKAATKKAKAS